MANTRTTYSVRGEVKDGGGLSVPTSPPHHHRMHTLTSGVPPSPRFSPREGKAADPSGLQEPGLTYLPEAGCTLCGWNPGDTGSTLTADEHLLSVGFLTRSWVRGSYLASS